MATASSSTSEISPRFVVFVVTSLLTHLMDVAGSGLFCHMLIQHDDLKTPWFSISAGLLIIPLVVLQLISAVYLLRRKGDNATTLDVVLTAVLHILQLGFLGRHFGILQESSLVSKKYDIAEILKLRLVFSLISGFPLLLIKIQVLFQDKHDASWNWTLYIAIVSSLLAITWALATFRRRLSEMSIGISLVSFPGTLLKLLWRAGEITTRVIALSLFASVFTYWIFLVIGLHWLAMIVCVCVPAITPLDFLPGSLLHRAFYSFITSFTYIFVFINTSTENSVFRYTFYYVIFFLENTVLITVWSVQASTDDFDKHKAGMYVAAIAFIISFVAVIIYYKFYHIPIPKEDIPEACNNSSSCASCKLNMPNDHPPIPPRPGAHGHWLGQYHTAIYCGQHCKHNGQDSLLDSTSEKNSIITVSSSHARLQQQLATINDENTDQSVGSSRTTKKSPRSPGNSSISDLHSASISPRSKTPSTGRKKSKKKHDNKSGHEKSSGKSSKQGRKKSVGDDVDDVQKQPVWLPSGEINFANQLLSCGFDSFGNNDTADDERSSVTANGPEFHCGREIPSREISSVHKHLDSRAWSSPRRGEDRHWYSDGYSTDRTLDWPNYPLASLHRKKYNSTTTSLDTDEDHFDFQECSHGDSEVSSIMRSIDEVPEPPSPGGRTHQLSDRHNVGEYRKHHRRPPHLSHPNHQTEYIKDQRHSHAHNKHHNHHHRSSRNTEVKLKESKLPDDISPRDINNMSKYALNSNKFGKRRTDLSPSYASDPSHGPKPKRKGSPKRSAHASAHHNRPSSSKLQSAKQSKPTKSNKSDNIIPRTIPNSDDPMIQSELQAIHLLRSSSAAKQSKGQTTCESPIASSDPRFNVRVMVTDTIESDRHTNDPERNRGRHSSSSEFDRENNTKTKHKLKSNVSKKTIAGVTKEESNVDDPTPLSETLEDQILSSHSMTDLSVVSGELSTSSGKKDGSIKSSSNSKHRSSASDSSNLNIKEDEVIYENIWQIKPEDKPYRHPTNKSYGVNNRGFIEDETITTIKSRSESSNIRDAWYMCSESEDSALPPEALSSSVDGFTGSDNGSDVSTEIVI